MFLVIFAAENTS